MGHTCAKAEKKQEKPTVTIAAPKKDPKVNTPREVVRDYSNMTVRNKYHFRLGLVGTSHSGKSTIGKQMRIGHGANLSEGTNEDARKIIVTNLVTTFKELVHQASRMKIDIENETVGEKIAQLDPAKTTAMTPDLADHIKTLWADEGIQQVFARRNEFEIPPNTEYGVDMVDKLADPKSLFNYEDVHIYLRGREKTMQVSETEFKVGIFSWHLVESGPEHENQKMWPTVFKGVIAMVFVAALDDWDIINSEDPKMRTRMQISLDLFEGMVNHDLFKDRAWVLLLNKRDLFKNKLQEHDLAKTFPEYKGGDDFDAAVDFVKGQYLARVHRDPKELDSHVLCALETEETNSVFEEALEYVFKKCSDL